jgi:hypothetical protein
LCHVFISFCFPPCPNNHWLCSHPTCFEQWPDEVGCVTEPLLVIKPFDDEKLVRLLFNMRKREWRDGEGVCVLHQQPHTFLGGENGREGHEGLLLASCWCSSPPVYFVRVFKIKKAEIFSSEKSKRNPPPFYPYLFP